MNGKVAKLLRACSLSITEHQGRAYFVVNKQMLKKLKKEYYRVGPTRGQLAHIAANRIRILNETIKDRMIQIQGEKNEGVQEG